MISAESIARFIEEIQALIERPTSNLTAASLMLAIVVITILVVLIVALLALTSSRQPRSGRRSARPVPPADRPNADQAQQHSQHRVRRWSRRQIVWACIAIVAAALVGTYVSTSSTSYCSSTCHAMTPVADTWAASTHADVSCRTCHESSFADAVTSRIRYAVAHVAGSVGSDLDAPVLAARCAACHPEALQNTAVESRGLRVVHGHFTSEGVDCSRCHGSVGHTERRATRAGSMSECLRCHDGVTASSSCATCHVDDVGLTTVEDRSFGRIRLPQPTCGGCHQEETCDACHGIRMPHPENYADPHLHAAAGAFDGRETLCYRCHTLRDCGECHSSLLISGGHPGNWRLEHRERTFAEGNGYCLSCHKTQDFCRVCHPE